MPKIIINESTLVKLIETAMDLDRYVQQTEYSTSNGNEDIEQTIQNIIDKLKELLTMFKYGKKTSYNDISNIHGILDKINELYDDIKFEK